MLVWNVVENIGCPGVTLPAEGREISGRRESSEWKVESQKLSAITRRREIESYHRRVFDRPVRFFFLRIR